jgi:uncharacterized SAM-dependent methyltransferase
LKYFSNKELRQLFSVSDKTIRNWIEASIEGKNSLELYFEKDKPYIVDSLKNDSLLNELSAHGRKYRNQRTHKRITPTSQFYEVYGRDEITEIIRSIEIDHSYPQHLRFRGKAADYWDAYIQHISSSSSRNYLSSQDKLLGFSFNLLDDLLTAYRNINIVDLGVGNGMAAKNLIQHVSKSGKLRRYIGIDGSKELLDITEKNIKNWFGSTIIVEKYVRDISRQSFGDVLASDSYGEDAGETINLVLLMGGTFLNFTDPEKSLSIIQTSLGVNDLLMWTNKLDGLKSRRFFDFNIESDRNLLPFHNKYVLDLLNINSALYDIEQFFDVKRKSRFIQVRLKATITLEFELDHYKKAVNLEKGETILILKVRHFTANEIVQMHLQASLNPIQVIQLENEEYALLISRVKRQSST